MRRILAYLAGLALLIYIAVWLADHPGKVSVDWLGWRLETNIVVGLAGLILLTFGLAVLFLTLGRLRRWPRRWREQRGDKRRRLGYQALSDGLAALAGGDLSQASRQARRAEKLLEDPALTRVLSVQIAEASGEAGAARDHFEAMLERPETVGLGLRGLLRDALASGDDERAIDLAVRARAASPGDKALAETLFSLLMKKDRLREADELLAAAGRARALSGAALNHRKALVANERAGRAEAGQDRRAAIRLSGIALKAEPAFEPAAIRLAGLYAAVARQRKAAAILENAWRHHPSRGLAQAYEDLVPNEDAMARLRRIEKLAALAPDDLQSHLALARAALAAKVWGQARRHLLAAEKAQPTAGTYRLLATLEEREFQNAKAAQDWLVKAAAAPADPTWQCDACGAPASGWSTACPACGAVDGLGWTSLRPAPLPKAAARA